MNAPALGTAARCPSASSQVADLVYGVVDDDLTTRYLETAVPVAPVLRGTAVADNRLRMSAPCAAGACGHWKDRRCSLSDAVIARFEDMRPEPAEKRAPPRSVEDARDEALPDCRVRPVCRWYAQSQAAACAACTHVNHLFDPGPR